MFNYFSSLVIPFKTDKQRERQIWQFISALLYTIFMISLSLNFFIRTVIVYHGSLWGWNEVFISRLESHNEQMYQTFSISSLEPNTMFCWPGFCFFQTYSIYINLEKLEDSLNWSCHIDMRSCFYVNLIWSLEEKSGISM